MFQKYWIRWKHIEKCLGLAWFLVWPCCLAGVSRDSEVPRVQLPRHQSWARMQALAFLVAATKRRPTCEHIFADPHGVSLVEEGRKEGRKEALCVFFALVLL